MLRLFSLRCTKGLLVFVGQRGNLTCTGYLVVPFLFPPKRVCTFSPAGTPSLYFNQGQEMATICRFLLYWTLVWTNFYQQRVYRLISTIHPQNYGTCNKQIKWEKVTTTKIRTSKTNQNEREHRKICKQSLHRKCLFSSSLLQQKSDFWCSDFTYGIKKIRTLKIKNINYLWRITYGYQGLWGVRLGSIRLG